MLRVVEIRGQRAGVRVAAAVGELGLRMPEVLVPRNTPTRSRPVARDRGAHRGGEAVLLQAQLRQPVVAAVEALQRAGSCTASTPATSPM